jgi:hypothetical protein
MFLIIYKSQTVRNGFACLAGAFPDDFLITVFVVVAQMRLSKTVTGGIQDALLIAIQKSSCSKRTCSVLKRLKHTKSKLLSRVENRALLVDRWLRFWDGWTSLRKR